MLYLSIGPRMPWLGAAMFDAIFFTGVVEGMDRMDAMGIFDQWLFYDRLAEVGGVGELDAIVGQDGVDCIGHRRHETMQEISGNPARRRVMQFGVGELRCTVDSNK